MRVVLASIHPQPLSGQIAGLQGLVGELRRLGLNVAAVSAGEERPSRGAPSPARGATVLAQAAAMARALRRLAKEVGGADLVHINLPTPAFAVVGELLQNLIRPPVIVGFEAHLADIGWLCRHGLRRDPRFYLPRLLVNNPVLARWPFHRCAGYVVSSWVGAVELHRLGFPARRVRVLSNVVEEMPDVPGGKAAARQELGMPQSPLLVYMGHYHHVKGVDTLVEAFGHLARQRPDCRLVLAWSGLGDPRPIDRRIEDLGVSDRVIRLGCVRPAALLQAADVLVLPYRSAMGQCIFPAAILEALQVGVPLVTTDLPDLRELFPEGRAASLVRPEDVAGIAAAVSRLLDHPAEAEAMVRAQRARVRGEQNRARIAEGYLRLYRETLRPTTEPDAGFSRREVMPADSAAPGAVGGWANTQAPGPRFGDMAALTPEGLEGKVVGE